MPKKILIYGEGWRGTLSDVLTKALQERGCEAFLFDYTRFMPGIKNRAFHERFRRRLLGRMYTRTLRKEFLRTIQSFKPDHVIIIKGLHLSSEVLSEIKAMKIFTVNWNQDDFLNEKNANAELLRAMPVYDLIVSSRPHLFLEYRKLGAKRLLYVDWYYVPDLHAVQNSKKTIEASFVGSWSLHRERIIGSSKMRFSIWGGCWENCAKSFRKMHNVNNEILSQVEMSRVFGRSKYNLNILTQENRDQTNLRLFEVAASGGLLLTERTEASQRYLCDRRDALMYSTVDELNEILRSDYDLERIAKSGCARIRSERHSFSDRVDTLMEAFEHD